MTSGIWDDHVILNLLPQNYKYLNKSCVLKFEGDVNFHAELRVNVTEKSEVRSFLEQLNTTLGCTFNIQSGRPDKSNDESTKRSKYSGHRKCCLNVKLKENTKSKQPGKNTDCPAKLNFSLDNPV